MIARDVLVAARATIADPAHWVQGVWAREGKTGSTRHPRDPRATCWCLGGAIVRSVPPGESHEALFEKLEAAAAHVLGPVTDGKLDMERRFVFVNDRLGHEAALKVLDLAIARETAG